MAVRTYRSTPCSGTSAEPSQDLQRVSWTTHILDHAGTKEIEACYRLRYDYFVCGRGWVLLAPSSPALEIDDYDLYCHHLAVFDGCKVLAYLRVLPYSQGIGFMLDREFNCLKPMDEWMCPHRSGNVELSRLVCAPDVKLDANGFHPVEHLLKALYGLASLRGYDQFTVVVEAAWLRPFERRFGLPFQPLGNPFTFPDGTRTVAATASLEELENGMRRHSAAKYAWYREAIKESGQAST